MLKKVFNWLYDTTISENISSNRYRGIGSTGTEIVGFEKNSKPQYDNMKAVFYMGIR
jgi:hypothetical protein